MGAVRISVGASSDGSMRTVFKPMVAAAKEARQQIQAEFEGLKGQMGATWKSSASEAAKAFAAMTSAEKTELDKQLAQVKEIEKAKAKAREESSRFSAESMREPGGGGGGRGRNDGYRTAYGSARYLDRTLRGAGRVAGDIARGSGVDLNLGDLVGKSLHLNKLATDLSNSGWQPNGEGAARNRVPAEALVGEARSAANKAALDPTKALEGMRQFVAITGDLQSARDLVGELGVMARASGTEFEDMVTAAGEVNAKLGDIPNKSQVTLSVLRAMAGQGKLGAIEIRQMATEMAKVGAAAKMFNMAPDQAMQTMGVLMQEARQGGGAKSASIAANAAMALVQNMTKATNIKAMTKAGLQPWADPQTKTKLLSPETMILAALYKTKGNMADLGGIFKDKMSMTAVRGFANIYNSAQGSPEQKLQATRDEFARLKKAQMGKGEVAEQFNASMATPEAKIQLFNNKLSEVGAEIAGKVLPAMEQLAPTVIKGVEAFGQFVAWAAENPGKALAAAITVSIARASLDTVLRAGIENLFKSAAGGGAGGAGGGGGKLGGAIGALGTALTIAATAVTIEQVGELVIDRVLKERDKVDNQHMNTQELPMVIGAEGRAARESGDTQTMLADQRKKADEERQLQARIAAANAYTKSFANGPVGGIISGVGNWIAGGGDTGTSFGAQQRLKADAGDIDSLRAALDKVHTEQAKTSARLTGGVLRVEVVNAGFSMVDASGRSPGAAVPHK